MPVRIELVFENREEYYYNLQMIKKGKNLFNVICTKEVKYNDIPAFLSKRMKAEIYAFATEVTLDKAIEIYERVDGYMHRSLRIEVEED